MSNEGVLGGECYYAADEKYGGQKGWYQSKETVEVGVADEEGRLQADKRRVVCCPNHYAGLSTEEQGLWEPIPDP